MQLNLTVLEKLQYDALNRLVATTPSTQAASQRFYLKDRLAIEIQGTEQRSIMQHDDQLLAQQQRQSGSVETRLLATDPQSSVLNVLGAAQLHPLAYTPYGHRPLGNGLLSLLGFNGERPDPVTGWYLLGTGYHRPFNPVLMCFTSPDSWSPFREGGLNAYAYCEGEPINRQDRTGRSWLNPFKAIKNKIDIAPGIFAFDDHTRNFLFRKQRRLNIFGHGSDEAKNGTHFMYSEKNRVTPEKLAHTLNIDEITNHKYKEIRLIMCNGGTGQHPYAQQLSDVTQLPVKSYIGRVSYQYIPRSEASKKEWIAIFKSKSSRPKEERRTFSYQPVHFKPTVKQPVDIRSP